MRLLDGLVPELGALGEDPARTEGVGRLLLPAITTAARRRVRAQSVRYGRVSHNSRVPGLLLVLRSLTEVPTTPSAITTSGRRGGNDVEGVSSSDMPRAAR